MDQRGAIGERGRPGPVGLDLPGPSRRITVEPLVLPEPARRPERNPAPVPERRPEAPPERAPEPEREREPV